MARTAWQKSFGVLVIAVLGSLSVQGHPLDDLARQALAVDPGAEGAREELRAAGLDGVEALLTLEPTEGKDREKWVAVLDRVCAQRDCAASGLYWYTDFEAAKEEARATGRPILSLRLLGHLDDEVSCANSRFFRTMLYPDPRVAKVLRERFVLHWKSVRPVPRLTIDYGDGRTLHGTVTGNSIHYVLDSNGRLVDGIPGLYGPGWFLEVLGEAERLALEVADLEEPLYLDALAEAHRLALAERDQELQEFGGVGAILVRSEPTLQIQPTALEAGEEAMYKAVVERPVLESLFGRPASPSDLLPWAQLAALRPEAWTLRPESLHLMAAKHHAVGGSPIALRVFEQMLGADTARNEYRLHTQLRHWLQMPMVTAPDLEEFNRRVYADLFLTPHSDPWLGLWSPETYLALAPEEEAQRVAVRNELESVEWTQLSP